MRRAATIGAAIVALSAIGFAVLAQSEGRILEQATGIAARHRRREVFL